MNRLRVSVTVDVDAETDDLLEPITKLCRALSAPGIRVAGVHIDPVMFFPNEIVPGLTPISAVSGPPSGGHLTDEEIRDAFKIQREMLDHVKGKDEPWKGGE
jgi:hypothetical protein